ncbi:MAG: tRNA (N6-threonylcarbamoyladenosine(37)-N6)-methyltransferase TrmO [Actinomycetota bacterium]
MDKYSISPIGKIRTPFKQRGKTPRQAAYSKGAVGTIEIYEEYRPGLEGLKKYEYVIVLFYFDRQQGYSLTARPPGAEEPRGVFATRSPRRPNHIGVSVVKLLEVEGNLLKVKGIDMLDGTPVIDIKPYVGDLDNR